MKILVVGQYMPYSQHSYGTTNSVVVREWHLCDELAARGHSVTMTGSPTDDPPKRFRVITADEVRIRDYDGIVLVPEAATLWVDRFTGQGQELRAHRNVVAWRDSWASHDRACTEFCKHIGILSAAQAEEAARANIHHLPWAHTDWPAQPNPWQDERPRVVFTGFLSKHEIDALNDLVEKVAPAEVWVCGIYGREAGPHGPFTTAERALLSPDIHWMTDITRAGIGPDEHGPLVYEEYLPFLWHATAALCFSRYRGAYPSKLYTYMSCGLPTVLEPPTDNESDLLNYGDGEVCSLDDLAEATLRAILRGLNPARKVTNREKARGVGTWADRAKTVEGWLS